MKIKIVCPCGTTHHLYPGVTQYRCAFCRADYVPAQDGQPARFEAAPAPNPPAEDDAEKLMSAEDALNAPQAETAQAEKVEAEKTEPEKIAPPEPADHAEGVNL